MFNVSLLKKIVWAIDAFEPDKKLYEDASRVIQSFMKIGVVVQPVYVLSAAELKISDDFTPSEILHYRSAAQTAIKKLLDSLKMGRTNSPHILVQRSSSLSEAVQLLSSYTSSIGGDLIVVSSHGRSGMSRLFLGSFAESLLLRTSIPVVVIGSKIREFHPLSRIVFPTDLSPSSVPFFRKVVRLAKSLNTELILLHTVSHPIEVMLQSGVSLLGGAWIPIHGFFGKDVDQQMRRANGWVRWSKNQGVATRCVIYPQGGSIAGEIVALADETQAGSIIMEEHSGILTAVLIGSITRQVIRSAHCPVWVYGATG